MDEHDSPPAGDRVTAQSSSETASASLDRLRRLVGISLLRRFSSRNLLEAEPGDALDELDRMIPPDMDDYHPQTGKRYQRQKELRPTAVREATASVFGERFSGEYEELVGATEHLFERFIVRSGRGGSSHFAQIDHFLAGYPNNIVEGLGDKASAKNVLAVIRVGQRLLELSDKRSGESDLSVLSSRGYVAEWLPSAISQLVALEDSAGLAQLETIAAEDHIVMLRAYLDFRFKYRDGWPSPALDPKEIVGTEAPASPFLREEAGIAWHENAWMGKEQRPPEWGDLAEMAARTDQWNREYGLAVRRDNKGFVSLGFIRGTDDGVKNKDYLGASGDKVFFHSHPRAVTIDGLYAPLISSGDVLASGIFDYGGAYLNIVCHSGITLQVDSRPITPDDPPGYTVESGDLRDRTLGSKDTPHEQIEVVLKKLRDSHEPYAYSFNATGNAMVPHKIRFVHIPWQHLNAADVTLEELCFGDGLRRILPPTLAQTGDTPPNLHSAIQKAKGTR